VERHKPLLREAEALFKHFDLHNIVTRYGDGMQGWAEHAPFERIMVTAAARETPPALMDQLADGGVMVIPIGDPDQLSQNLVRITKRPSGDLSEEILGEVRFVPLLSGVESD